MAICLLMNKEFEDEEIVVYQYYPSESPEKVGKMYFHKKGNVLWFRTCSRRINRNKKALF